MARWTLIINDFMSRGSDLISKGGNRAIVATQLKKTFHRYATGFQKFGKSRQ